MKKAPAFTEAFHRSNYLPHLIICVHLLYLVRQ